jgi:phage repressor protein C with HTH and peptisase S24 domain
MKLDRKLADKITTRFERFASRWDRLDEKKRQDAEKMTIMVEMLGGRNQASVRLGVSDNTIDNYRKGIGDLKHAALRDLTEHVGFPLSALYFRWRLEEDELLFTDEWGTEHREPGELDRRRTVVHDDLPPLPYVPGYDEVARPPGLAEEAGYPHFAMPPDYLGRLGVDPSRLAVMAVAEDGMAPEFEPGATLLVDTGDRDMTDGCVYALNTDVGPVVRRARRLTDGGLELLCAPEQGRPPRRVPEADISSLDIIGRVRVHHRLL